MDNKQKILDRLRKLYALGQSPNQHEAEAAMAKAAQLMEEYQIGATEIDLAEAGDISREDMVVAKNDGVKHFVYNIARAASIMFDGHIAKAHVKTSITFIGTPMKMTFIHLYKSWQSIVEADLREAKAKAAINFAPRDTILYKQGHGVGFGLALCARARKLQDERQKSVNEKSVTGRDLIVVKGNAILNFMERQGYRPKSSRSSQGDFGGRVAGAVAGSRIPLHGGIAGGEFLRRIGSK